MDGTRFDVMTRELSGGSRRGLLTGLVGVIGLASALTSGGEARSRRRKKKVAFNTYGCVDVGKPCRGKSANCCSGICDGKKPRKGKKDTSRCVAHHTGGCQAGTDVCQGIQADCGTGGYCLETTGKAPFCGDPDTDQCVACAHDTDCQAALGPGAACVYCAVLCPQTQGRMCIAAAPGTGA